MSKSAQTSAFRASIMYFNIGETESFLDSCDSHLIFPFLQRGEVTEAILNLRVPLCNL